MRPTRSSDGRWSRRGPRGDPAGRRGHRPDDLERSAATPLTAGLPVLLPERSRLPVDAFTGYVDIMIDQTGRVITGRAWMGGGAYANSPLSSQPFYHFWLTEREGVVPPIFGLRGDVHLANRGDSTSRPQPEVTDGNSAPRRRTTCCRCPRGGLLRGQLRGAGRRPTPYLTGERRLVTLFVKTGQIVSNSIQNFNVNDTNAPFYDAQAGIKESQ